MRTVGPALIAFLLMGATTAAAQAPPGSYGGPPPGAASGGPPPGPMPSGPPPAGQFTKRLQCRQAAQAKGLVGQALHDDYAQCLAQVRADCTKFAIARHISGPDRRDFIHGCESQ